MSANPISMTQVQGLLHQSKRRFGATAQTSVAKADGMSRFEALLREPQQIADAIPSTQNSQPISLSNQFSYFGLTGVEQNNRAGMNLRNISALATLTNIASIEPSTFSNALKSLTEAAERIQLDTTAASGAAVHSQELMGMPSVTFDKNAAVASVDGSTQENGTGDDTAQVEALFDRQERGSLAAMFESGAEGGIAAIGYDVAGGTSYGKYQYSSARGTMDDFLTYLDSHASDISLHLRAAGELNTGSKHGEMPTAWKEVAAIDPIRFEKMQDEFMQSRYFTPVANVIQSNINVGKLSKAMEEVLLSTSLQHGPSGAVRIFAKAFGRTGGFTNDTQASFIKNVYDLRGNEFATSEPEVRSSVQNRLRNELDVALSMLA